jgi:uncharacterized ion transporter superfamily protein YfcC
MPHPLALLLACVLVAAAVTHLLSAGRYERRDDPATGRTVSVDAYLEGIRSVIGESPRSLAALLMVPVQALLHIPVSSVSGQAVLTMPVMVPLADLLGVSRQATVLAYQTGAGLTEFWAPTNGVLMAVLLAL